MLLKGKITAFEKDSVFVNDKWIGNGHLVIRKDVLDQVTQAKIEARGTMDRTPNVESVFPKSSALDYCNYGSSTNIYAEVTNKYSTKAIECCAILFPADKLSNPAHVTWVNREIFSWFVGLGLKQPVASDGAIVAYDDLDEICGIFMPIANVTDKMKMIGDAIVSDNEKRCFDD